ncbi:cupin domain-containing protein [Natrialbaceae archaeon GCM10025810]|uniref:cupin domain-containing protein n=1 Tax=Halovalidus salilacus TaxID=3075124 RepID=UPI00360BEA93
MSYDTASKTDPESVVDEEWGGMWFLKDELETDHLGFTVLELEPGGKGMEHDEAESGQEEIYYVVEGEFEVELRRDDGDETVTVEAEDAIRLDPDERRQIFNRGDERATMVLVGASI